MKPEAADHLAKAKEDLTNATKIADIGLLKVAARSAYYAMFHAAEAYIFEWTGKAVKTHSGLRAEFARLSRDDPSIERAFVTSLAQTYKYKELADYGTGDAVILSQDEVEGVIARASVMLTEIEFVLACRP